MIRRSTAIGAVAIFLSLLVHFVGLNFTSRIQPEQLDEAPANDVIALGNTFEDVAENLSEPVVPEDAPIPEPETVNVPEPESADTPTSEVLVASPNPQHTYSPDTGTAQVVQPETTGPSELDQSQAPEPETVGPSGGDQGTTANVAETPPVEPATIAEAPKGIPDAKVNPVEAVIAETVLKPLVTPAPKPDAPQRLAALPVTPALKPSDIPVIPPERETVAPEAPETLGEPLRENTESVRPEDESDGSDLAVVTSLRPPRLEIQPSTETLGLSDGSTDFNELLAPPLIESPLAAFLRDGTDLKVRKNGRAQSGGLGFIDSRGPGNSDVTNYAGQVLVHLNRAPAVHVSAKGSARVFFEIKPDGTLGRIDIIDSTGSEAINRAAKAQIRKAAPFPRPPKGVHRRLSFIYWSN
jgi:periplasmic protein TonB